MQQRVRRSDFELRKVKGEVKPADLFTTHLESQAKLDSSLKICGCKLRGGRPSAAPALRREAMADVCPIHDNDDNDDNTPTHDTTRLPHQIPAEKLDRYFPKAEPVQAPLGVDDEGDELDCRDPVLKGKSVGTAISHRVREPDARRAREPDVSVCLCPAVELSPRSAPSGLNLG